MRGYALELFSTREALRLLREKPLLLPIASVEDHGPLPLGSDLLLANCVLERLHGKAVVAPTIPYSLALEHVERFAVTASLDSFAGYLRDLLLSLASVGAFRVLILVFHGGATYASACATREAVLRSGGRLRARVVDFWAAVAHTTKKLYGVNVNWVIHADPLEASLLAACGLELRCGLDPQEALEKAAAWPKRSDYVLSTWLSHDYPELYEEREIPCSLELGKELLEEVVKLIERELEELA